MALVYDTFLVLPVIMLAFVIAMALAALADGEAAVQPLNPWLAQGLILLCLIGFFSAFWIKSGQTLGMQAWRVKLVALPGKRLTVARCALRCLGAVLSAACLGLGYLWCLIDRRGRYWHDYLSGTALVLVPKRGK
ncbi:putative transmembrane protein [Pseudohaliea rubra DSM 19751]|uniref:Putative transmembrane protein n=2 Tax=Pseudohaliea TaxID=1341120 RepID=A0A095VPC4_9GAMM|nr:putative transmembrane protein [Pseudohaliea rubra DSM 19751]